MIHFGDIPRKYATESSSAIAVLPVPYDETSTWIKGANKGPEAILEASANLELYDIQTGTEVYLRGIYTADPVTEKRSPEKMVSEVYKKVNALLENKKFPVIIGGEHSVSIGSIQAFTEHFPGLSVLQLDAHSDLRNEYNGSRFNHACVMARVKEIASAVQVGIRATDSGELSYMDPDRVFFAHQIYYNNQWMDKAVDLLSEHVYVTIDLDVFDPSVMPSTGTPEPGGLNWYQLLPFLEKLVTRKKLVGFDVVELCPSSLNKAPDFLAAKLIYRLLSMQFSKKR